MNNYYLRIVQDAFARLFVLAVKQKMNLLAITINLENSEYVRFIEKGDYTSIANKDIKDIYQSIFGVALDKDDSAYTYNDAYWSGYSYFQLHLRTNKSFAYLFLKLPLARMLDMYPVYHEMDITQLEEEFHRLEKEKTILRSLCENGCISLSKLSDKTSISQSTLAKYNKDDEYLYNASFQNVIAIADYFNCPISLFKE